MPVPAIILAAGASRRLGQPKQLVRVGGETLLSRTMRVARESGLDPIFVVLGAHHEQILSAVDMSSVQVIVNHDWEQGIASSIRAGLEGILLVDPNAMSLMLLVCDQPKLSAVHLRKLIDTNEQVYERKTGPAIVASRYAGVAGIPAIFPVSQFPGLLALQGDSGAKSLLRDSASHVVEIEFDGGEIDVDLPSDIETALQQDCPH
ncbi:MAG TPA: nucleotidyltransferase family protein [Acidobacteriaceae bacterium]|jgi:CTP:molybdopterin cytidylyltransferase MocA|nr:nucleotidyltransferase family protein [Acidobacteriaceae bacterium]